MENSQQNFDPAPVEPVQEEQKPSAEADQVESLPQRPRFKEELSYVIRAESHNLINQQVKDNVHLETLQLEIAQLERTSEEKAQKIASLDAELEMLEQQLYLDSLQRPQVETKVANTGKMVEKLKKWADYMVDEYQVGLAEEARKYVESVEQLEKDTRELNEEIVRRDLAHKAFLLEMEERRARNSEILNVKLPQLEEEYEELRKQDLEETNLFSNLLESREEEVRRLAVEKESLLNSIQQTQNEIEEEKRLAVHNEGEMNQKISFLSEELKKKQVLINAVREEKQNIILQKDTRLKELKNESCVLENSVTEIKLKTESLKSNLEELDQKCEKVENAIATAQHNKTSSTLQKLALSEANVKLLTQQIELQKAQTAFTDTAKQLENLAQTVTTASDTLTAENTNTAQQLKEAQEMYIKLQQMRAQELHLSARKATLEPTVLLNKAELTLVSAEINKLRGEIETQNKTHDQMQEQFETLTHLSEKLAKEEREMTVEYNRMFGENAGASGEVTRSILRSPRREGTSGKRVSFDPQPSVSGEKRAKEGGSEQEICYEWLMKILEANPVEDDGKALRSRLE